MVKLILSDVDGTLLARGEGAFDDSVFEVIDRLYERGIHFAAASGRGYSDLHRLFAPVRDKMAFVCSDGAMTISDGKILDINSMNKNDVTALAEDITCSEGCEFLLYGREKLYISPKTEKYRGFIVNRYRDSISFVDSVKDVGKIEDDFLKLSVYAINGVDSCSSYFKDNWMDTFELVYNANNWMEFVAKGISKVSGVEALCRKYSIDMDEVMAFGDGGNDIKLLGTVAYGYAMDYYRRELYFDIEFQKYLQFTFYKQWNKLKAYVNSLGIRMIGDIPIYVAMDSADAWANPSLFQLDEKNVPYAVAGCPPDGFSATGQLWGNPLYRWEYHRQTGYEWWLKRLSHCFKLYDAVRIDHFRGFDQYYSIPYGAEDATRGHWEQGPGIDLFNRVRQVLGEKEVIAEDLGYVTDSVRKLVYDSGFPGMKVLEFAFDSRDSGCANDYLPHNYPENSVAYTGTHDNETLAGWFDSITKEEQNMVRDYLCDHYTPKKYLYKSLNSLVMRSKAALCVIPMQDYLGLDNHYRMNKPSTVGENWKWRLKKGELTDLLKEEIRGMTRRYGRLNGQ